MSGAIVLDNDATAQLTAAIQPKLVEAGWMQDGEDTTLAEYIILMLANGKNEEQVAAELAGDLLGLGPDDPGAREFSHWLFQQIAQMQSGGAQQEQQSGGEAAGGDEVMGDASESSTGLDNIPTGPKSMRTNGANGANRGRDRRMLGALQKNLDGKDPLRRVGTHGGVGRINTHAGRNSIPSGPRGGMQRGGRGAAMGGHAGGAQTNMPMMSPQQQMEMLQMMQSMISGQMPMNMPGVPFNAQQPPRNNRSLFDRAQRGNHQGRPKPQQQQGENQAQATSPLDMELTPAREPPSPDNVCKFNLRCTNKDCKFAHQSPAAPPGITVDVHDVCAFGVACLNRKCTGRHPSPAQKAAHAAEQDCKFFPNCTNPRCPFKHPSMPLCRNGPDCKEEGCKFTHMELPQKAVKCRFNPCLNPHCVFQHEEGQKRGKFEDKVWVNPATQGHLSDRKFVGSEEQEELIKPDQENQASEESLMA